MLAYQTNQLLLSLHSGLLLLFNIPHLLPLYHSHLLHLPLQPSTAPLEFVPGKRGKHNLVWNEHRYLLDRRREDKYYRSWNEMPPPLTSESTFSTLADEDPLTRWWEHCLRPIEDMDLAWRPFLFLTTWQPLPPTWSTPGLWHPQRLLSLKSAPRSSKKIWWPTSPTLQTYQKVDGILWTIWSWSRLSQMGRSLALSIAILLPASRRSGSSTTSVMTLLSASKTAATLCLTSWWLWLQWRNFNLLILSDIITWLLYIGILGNVL